MFPEKGNLFQQGLNLFRPTPEPKELVRKWQSMLRTETRRIDSQIREIQRCAPFHWQETLIILAESYFLHQLVESGSSR